MRCRQVRVSIIVSDMNQITFIISVGQIFIYIHADISCDVVTIIYIYTLFFLDMAICADKSTISSL